MSSTSTSAFSSKGLASLYPVAPTVRSCYDVLSLCPRLGIDDFTDGMYVDERNDPQAYLAAQERQAEYLLDQVCCRSGSRLLDVGCGYGRILAAAELREAEAVGITISPQQLRANLRRGLDVQLRNYRNLLSGSDADPWHGRFDCIIANGSLEHFVQAEDAAAGRDDAIYTEMFEIFRGLLRPGGRLATTAIHCLDRGQVDPHELVKSPEAFPRGSELYHAANLHRSFGGWFPYPGQLERCAAGKFELVAAEEGTHDYSQTSEYWIRQIKRALCSSPGAWVAAAKSFANYPKATYRMLRCLLVDQSWNYQFRDPAPTQLWRQTWAAV